MILVVLYSCRYTYSQWLYLGQLKRSTIFPHHIFRERFPKSSTLYFLTFLTKSAFSNHGRFFVTSDDAHAAFEISFNYDANIIQFNQIETFGIKIADNIVDENYYVEQNNITDPRKFPLYDRPEKE